MQRYKSVLLILLVAMLPLILCQEESPPTAVITSQNLSYIDPKGIELLKLYPECGSKYFYARNLQMIAHGKPPGAGDFPWMVLLKYETTGRPYLCGGSLITDRFVLTAAHCTTTPYKLVAVRVGDYDLDNENGLEEEYGIEEILTHPNYKQGSISYDIALIKLDKVVEFEPYIEPICLPINYTSQDILDNEEFYIAGWGQTVDEVPSPILLMGQVKLQHLDVCRKYYSNAPVSENHICAMGDSKQETCHGDSGGPLFVENLTEFPPHYVQFGVISFGGSSCGINKDQPGVFASVIDMLPWITQNIY